MNYSFSVISGNSSVNQTKQQHNGPTKNLLWPSHSFSENSRPVQQPSSASKSSRYYSSSFRSFENPSTTICPNGNVSTVQFELTDENSLVRTPHVSNLVKEKKKNGSASANKSANSVKYIFLKQDDNKNSDKIHFSSMNS